MVDLKKKILWQCRRGLWELDAILIPFVERNFDDLDSENKTLFTELLSYEDIEVFDLLVNNVLKIASIASSIKQKSHF